MTEETTTTEEVKPFAAIVPNLTDEEYFARPETSRSDLVNFATGSKPTGKHLTTGDLCHLLCLQDPSVLKDRYCTLKKPAPIDDTWDYDLRTKAGQMAKEECEKANPGKIVVKYGDKMAAAAMAANLKAHPAIGPLLWGRENSDKSTLEASIVGKTEWSIKADPECSIKTKVDIITDKSVIDIKTTYTRTPEEFDSSFFKFRYHVQAAFLLDLADLASPQDAPRKVVYVGVHNKPPHNVFIYKVHPWMIEAGRIWAKDVLRIKNKQSFAEEGEIQ